jgi:hypothetical protein
MHEQGLTVSVRPCVSTTDNRLGPSERQGILLPPYIPFGKDHFRTYAPAIPRPELRAWSDDKDNLIQSLK